MNNNNNEFIMKTETMMQTIQDYKITSHNYILSRSQNMKAFECYLARLTRIYVDKKSLKFDAVTEVKIIGLSPRSARHISIGDRYNHRISSLLKAYI